MEGTKVIGDIPVANLEAVNIKHLVQDVLGQVASHDLAAYTIHVQVSEQLMVWADPQFLRQMLRNLLTNIFKYVPTQTETCIEATQVAPTPLP